MWVLKEAQDEGLVDWVDGTIHWGMIHRRKSLLCCCFGVWEMSTYVLDTLSLSICERFNWRCLGAGIYPELGRRAGVQMVWGAT